MNENQWDVEAAATEYFNALEEATALADEADAAQSDQNAGPHMPQNSAPATALSTRCVFSTLVAEIYSASDAMADTDLAPLLPVILFPTSKQKANFV